MTQAFASEVTLSFSLSLVWTALTDWENAPRWMSGIDSLQARGATASGTQLVFHTRGKDRTATISACESEKVLVLRSQQGGVVADYAYRLASVDAEHTRLTLVAECHSTGWLWKLLGPMIRLAIRATDGKQLSSFQAMMEAR